MKCRVPASQGRNLLQDNNVPKPRRQEVTSPLRWAEPESAYKAEKRLDGSSPALRLSEIEIISATMAPSEESTSRNILISGGARGIGRALARYLLEEGNRVYILDIDEEELKHTTTVHLERYHKGGKLESALCNLRDVQDIRTQVRWAARFLDNRIDVLINNGGIASPKWSEDRTMEDPETLDQWQAYIETNLTAPFVMSQSCIPHMKMTGTDNDTGAQKMKGA